MTLPQVPIPAGIPGEALKAIWRGQIVSDNFGFETTDQIPATSIDPSRLKALEKAVNTAKPMGAEMSACKFPGHDAYACGGVRSDLPPYAVPCPGCGYPSSGRPKTKYAHVWRWYMQTEAAKPYTERDIIELMVRAPACPEWFEPDMSAYFVPERPSTELEIDRQTQQATTAEWRDYSKAYYNREFEKSREKVIQWPRAYAIMVLKAK